MNYKSHNSKKRWNLTIKTTTTIIIIIIIIIIHFYSVFPYGPKTLYKLKLSYTL